MKAIRLATAIIMIVLLVFYLPSGVHAKRVVGLTIGTGMSFPMSDLADKDKYRAKSGSRITLGIDVYPIQALSIGPFLNGDFFHPGEVFLEQGHVLLVSSVSVAEFGGTLRYHFRSNSHFQPYSKLWFGVSWLNIFTKESSMGTSSNSVFGWGLGGGVLFTPVNNIGFSADLMYNNTKTEPRDGGDNTSRINLGVALHLLVG